MLKLLQETYLGKIKMIYIDPPYNTGHDFVYNDKFSVSPDEWDEMSGELDEYGNRLVQNNESNGRFHTDWLNMIYPRLKIARDLLTDDGVIFISIDDGEVENVIKLCCEIFGQNNFIAQVVWERSFAPVNLKKHFSESHDYILCFSKNISNAVCNGLPRGIESDSRYSNPDNDPRGVWQSDNATVGPAIPEKVFEIVTPSGRRIMPPSGRCWLYTKARFQEMIRDNRIWFGEDGNNVPRVKRFLSEVKQGLTPMTIWKYSDVGHSQDAAQKLKQLFDGHDFFDYPKPIELIKRCIQLYTRTDSIVLDFFSGSATTAHAVIRQNFQDVFDGKKGKRKFIMVQLPEKTDEKSEAYKAGYKNICEIGKERIRRAGKNEYLSITGTMGGSQRWNEKRKAELGDDYFSPSNVDIGFRVLKLDFSNMKDVYYNPADFQKSLLDTTIDNIKEDRTPEDLLFQIMLELGVLLSEKIEESEIAGKKVFNVANGYLIACFDSDVNEETITAVAKQKPIYFVMRDSSLSSDTTATNFDQIFETYSPDTVRKVI